MLAAACCTVTPAQSATACGPAGFAYAGIQPSENGHGISAVLTALAVPVVESGHVAGWIGVGGPGQGPGGTDEWIQVGLNSMPGTGNTLYFEVMRPGSGVRYAEVATDVPVGQAVRVAVLETAATSGAWRVWVDGKAVTPPIALRSGDSLTPMAMGESWDAGMQPLSLPLPATCDRGRTGRLVGCGGRRERVSGSGLPGDPARAGLVRRGRDEPTAAGQSAAVVAARAGG